MKTLYKYRPLSEFLFKELLYQELYFASYYELNDPLDLSARIEFNANDKEAIEYLIWFMFKTQFDFDELKTKSSRIEKLMKFNKNEKEKDLLRDSIFESVDKVQKTKKSIWINDIIKIIINSLQETKIDIDFDSIKFKNELDRLTNKFLKNSYVSCFSESNDDFLMWSHYASKHSGICLEFRLENAGLFPYEMFDNRMQDKENYLKRISKWENKSSIYWDRIRKVSYEDEQPFINFYKFAPVFENEHDYDLIGLSKSWTHEYAHELEWVFSTKIKNWQYENEWRAIQINFGDTKEPEERVRHYPIEALNAIYFGINTPENVKKRIYKIFDKKDSKIEFYDSKLNGTNVVDFDEWEYPEE